MDRLTLIFLENQVSLATYISKDTTELDLQLVAISLVKCRPSLSWVMIPFLSLLHKEFSRALLTRLLTFLIHIKSIRFQASPLKAPRKRITVILLLTGRRRWRGSRTPLIPSWCHPNCWGPTPKRLSPPSKLQSLSLDTLLILFFREG